MAYWAYATIEENDIIRRLSDIIYRRSGREEYQPEKRPHLTIHPSFKVCDTGLEAVRGVVEESGIEGQSVDVEGVVCWPNNQTPYVVSVSLDMSLESVRSDIDSVLQEYDGEHIWSPSDPHITLMKADAEGPPEEWDIDPRSRSKVLDAVEWVNSSVPMELTIESVIVRGSGYGE